LRKNRKKVKEDTEAMERGVELKMEIGEAGSAGFASL
jgi:hypothetical protein